MIKATVADKKLVVAILVEAFGPIYDDSSINYTIKQDDKRLERMEILMGYLFDKAMRFGDVFLSDNKACCLLVNYTKNERFTWAGLYSTLNLAINCIGIFRVFKVLKRQRIIKQYYPKIDHIRPMIFAVKDEFRGGVTAPKLLMQVFKVFKGNKMPVIVDTVSESNVRLYEKFGLRVFNTEKSLGYTMYLLRMN